LLAQGLVAAYAQRRRSRGSLGFERRRLQGWLADAKSALIRRLNHGPSSGLSIPDRRSAGPRSYDLSQLGFEKIARPLCLLCAVEEM
jgi:hypothetical protein